MTYRTVTYRTRDPGATFRRKYRHYEKPAAAFSSCASNKRRANYQPENSFLAIML